MQQTKVGPYEISFENSVEFHGLKREIWGRHDYFAELDNPEPVILDIGAHIGLSTLYFAYLFPKATIVALEPNPELFPILTQNIFENHLEKRVFLTQTAVDVGSRKRTFYMDASADRWYSTGGFIDKAWNQRQKSAEITVQTTALRALLDQKVDLMKMDIEGVEQAVLFDARDELHNIGQILLEYHPVPSQSIEGVGKILADTGMKVSYFKDGKEQPLKKLKGLILIKGERVL